RLATELARRQQAHLIGLAVVDVVLPIMAAADAASGAVLAELMERMRSDALEEAARVEAEFRETLRREALSGEWRCVEGAAPELVALHTRYADIAVLGQANPDDGPPSASAILEATLFGSGRPVLVIPYAGTFETLGQRVVV